MVKKNTKKVKSKKIKTVKSNQNTDNKKGPFLERLFKILKKEENNNIIKWINNGTQILIKDPIEFSGKILPKYFNHDNYEHFIRQLNYYSFSKVKNIYNSKSVIYFNEYFHKNIKFEEIKNIKRKTYKYEASEEEEKDNDNNIKEPILSVDQDNEDDKRQIMEFKKLIKDENFNIRNNKKILEFLFKKDQEEFEFYKKKFNEIQELKIKYKVNSQVMHYLNNNINFKKNSFVHEENKNMNGVKNRKYILVHTESFIMNPNDKLNEAFKNVNDIKIEKHNDNDNDNLNGSYVEEINRCIFEEPKFPKPVWDVNKTSFMFGYSFINNNSIRNNSINSSL